MSRLMDLLKAEYPDSVKEIKILFPEISIFPDLVVEKLWMDYSESLSAGYMIVNKEEVEHFRRWLE